MTGIYCAYLGWPGWVDLGVCIDNVRRLSISGLLTRSEKNEAKAEAEARKCEVEDEAKKFLWGRDQNIKAEATVSNVSCNI